MRRSGSTMSVDRNSPASEAVDLSSTFGHRQSSPLLLLLLPHADKSTSIGPVHAPDAHYSQSDRTEMTTQAATERFHRHSFLQRRPRQAAQRADTSQSEVSPSPRRCMATPRFSIWNCREIDSETPAQRHSPRCYVITLSSKAAPSTAIESMTRASPARLRDS